ncbi:MAG: anmK [Rhodospirillaceae bacterium]|nr:MAG: anmK [Rhodospirillaceae bacterium]
MGLQRVSIEKRDMGASLLFFRPLRAIGLMSGTSLDGIDAALLITDGRHVLACGPTSTLAYDEVMRSRLRSVLAGTGPVFLTARELTLRHAEIVGRLLAHTALDRREVDVIGFHGQTVLHRPDLRLTWQIGDGAALARMTGIDVVSDFRTADIDHGGEGAPLVPIYHAALARSLPERPIAVLNLGGVGNVTWIPSGENDGTSLLAFDTGPGNALIDDWVFRHTGHPLDQDGRLALAGRVDTEVLAALVENPYFDRPPPKSLDRDTFAPQRLLAQARGGRHAVLARLAADRGSRSLSLSDGAATLTAFTAVAVSCAVPHFPAPPTRWLVCGGGRHNPALMAALRQHLPVPVEPVEHVGWNGDALEAQAFAFLAVRALRGLPLTFPGTTGVSYPITGGILHSAHIPQDS